MTPAQAAVLAIALGIVLGTLTVCCLLAALAADRCVQWAADRLMWPAILRRTR